MTNCNGVVDISDDYVVPCGKYKDRTLGEIPLKELDEHLGFLEGLEFTKKDTKNLIQVLRNYLSQPSIKKELESLL